MAQSHFSTFIIFFKNLNFTKMTEEELLKLFEQNWWERPVFFNKGKDFLTLESKVKESELEETQEEEEPVEKNLAMRERAMSDETMMRSFKTSLSDSSSSSDDMFLSPRSVLTVKASKTKLQTILSGKEVDEFVKNGGERVPDETEKQRNVRTRRGKSMSDLEYEELKGFMDLGFVFSSEDYKDTDLVSILPGLQRLVKKDGVEVTEEDKGDGNRVARPYLSEAWDHCQRRKGKRQVTPEMRWRIPVPERENDLKEQLKLWAHAVATTIR